MRSRFCLFALLLVACGGRVQPSEGAPAPPDDAAASGNPRATTGPDDAGIDGAADATTEADATATVDSGDAAPATTDAEAAVPCTVCGEAGCVDTTIDPNHCGGCDVLCGGTCTGGRCLEVLADSYEPVALVLDAENVYFTSYDGRVGKVPIAGGAATTLVSGLKAPWGITLDGATVYFADPNIVGGFTGATIRSVPTAGGPATTVVSNQIGGTIVVVAAGNVYWDNGGWESTSSEIQYAPLKTGTPTLLVPPYPKGFASVRSIVHSGDRLYYTEDYVGLLSVPIAGGASTLVSSVPAGAMVLDETNFYFTSSNGSIVKLPRAGGAPVTLATGDYDPTGIAVDGAYVYWTNEQGIDQSSVRRVPIVGGAVETLASNQGDATAIAVDDKNVYWLCTTSNGSIRKMNK
jgi:hypothetical protein